MPGLSERRKDSKDLLATCTVLVFLHSIYRTWKPFVLVVGVGGGRGGSHSSRRERKRVFEIKRIDRSRLSFLFFLLSTSTAG